MWLILFCFVFVLRRSCIQQANECTLDDMPCYGSSFVEDTGGTTRDGVGTLSGALLATVAAAILAV